MEHTVSKLFSYKPIQKYEGLEGKIPIKHKDVYVGVELELENFPDIFKTTAVNATEDGSLKLNGVELVTIPIKLRYLEVELNRILQQLENKVLISARCSTHVHMNVRDMTPQQIGNMILLYMIFERSLYRFSGDRWNNNFCVPLYMYTPLVNGWFKYEEYHNEWKWYKYTGLNLSPIWGGESSKIGTVEFRQMEGTIDVVRIINWCNLITSLKRAAQDMDREEILSHIRIMKTTSGYWWLAKEIFGNWAKMLTNQPTFTEDVEKCITHLKVALWAKQAVASTKKNPAKGKVDDPVQFTEWSTPKIFMSINPITGQKMYTTEHIDITTWTVQDPAVMPAPTPLGDL